jgi:hypothetical protein
MYHMEKIIPGGLGTRESEGLVDLPRKCDQTVEGT